MAIETVQELVTKLQNTQAQIKAKQLELEKLRKIHLEFWEKFQQKCQKTGHSLTQEEKEALVALLRKDTKTRRMRRDMDKYYRPTQLDFRIADLNVNGYRCSHCLKNVPGTREIALSRSVRTDMDLCKRKSFANWVGYQEDKWPAEKRAVFKKVKKEVDNYFAKAEPLEQEIEKLKREAEETMLLLEPIWELIDKALGKDVQRERERTRLCDEYEEQIRAVKRCIPRTYDPDAYYQD